MKSKLSKKIIISFIVFFAFPFVSFAQVLDLSISPISPEPNQAVTATIKSFNVDLNNTEISWFLDNKLIKKGVGQKDFVFTTGEKSLNLKASIKNNNQLVESSLQINPSSINLLWEVVGGYEPPFYKGKVMPVKDSFVKVVAIPQVKDSKNNFISPKNFTYDWRKDLQNMAGQSGYGKDGFTFRSEILDKTNTITVGAGGGGRFVSRNVSISYGSPAIHFYEYHPIYGPLYNKAIKSNTSLKTRKFNIIAEPYFAFTNDLQNPSLETFWKINNSPHNSPEKNIVFLNVAENVNSFSINFEINNKGGLLQRVNRSLNLNIQR